MKSITIALLSILSITLNAQNMEKINETVAKLFIATDDKDWQTVESIFAGEVILDYSSMNGNPATSFSPKQIVDRWKTILPGFEHTHHQLGNFVTNANDSKAEVFCYGTATHYLNDAKGNIWTVIGSYDFELIVKDNKWKISKMKFNFKYQDGNLDLPKKAIENLKQ